MTRTRVLFNLPATFGLTRCSMNKNAGTRTPLEGLRWVECQNGEVWGDLGDPREPARGPRGPKAQTKRSDDGLIWDPMPKVAKTVILSTVLKGSPRGPREAKS